MKYLVKVDYKKFQFDDRDAAMDFAEVSKTSSVEPITVEIVLKNDEEA